MANSYCSLESVVKWEGQLVYIGHWHGEARVATVTPTRTKTSFVSAAVAQRAATWRLLSGLVESPGVPLDRTSIEPGQLVSFQALADESDSGDRSGAVHDPAGILGPALTQTRYLAHREPDPLDEGKPGDPPTGGDRTLNLLSRDPFEHNTEAVIEDLWDAWENVAPQGKPICTLVPNGAEKLGVLMPFETATFVVRPGLLGEEGTISLQPYSINWTPLPTQGGGCQPSREQRLKGHRVRRDPVGPELAIEHIDLDDREAKEAATFRLVRPQANVPDDG